MMPVRIGGTGQTIDACGNSTTATQTITLIDTIAPVFASPAPADTIVSCDSIPAPVVLVAADNCDPGVEITYKEVAIYHPTADWKSTGTCSILFSVSNVQCDDKGTPATGDDTITFDLVVIGQNTRTY